VAVTGKLVHRNYTDKNGVKRYVTEVVLNEMLMLGGGKTQIEQVEPQEDDAEM
jgi:single-strand DNA-binding protein